MSGPSNAMESITDQELGVPAMATKIENMKSPIFRSMAFANALMSAKMVSLLQWRWASNYLGPRICNSPRHQVLHEHVGYLL